MKRVFEQGNRRAEVDGTAVQFFRMSGTTRRSKTGVWATTCQDERQAKRLGQRWAFKGMLGKTVLH